MIIKYPTGLYKSVLPVNPQDAGNVTFTISTTVPPRTNLIFPKISIGVVDRGRIQSARTESLNYRKYLGALIFSVSSANPTQVGNNSRQYELGQVLEFTDDPRPTIDPMFVAQTTEIQHNTNMLDYDAMGVSASDQDVIAAQSLITYTTLTNQLNLLKQQRSDAEIVVNTQQKTINEVTRTISALNVILLTAPNSDISELVEKLTVTKDAAVSVRDEAIVNAGLYSSQADDVIRKIRSLALVLK